MFFNNANVHVVTWAKRFLFLPDQLDMPVSRLSGGEKARIVIANLMLSPCDILFLDEPTNDLDILSLEILEDSIRQFAGAVVVVSHDRYLMDQVCHRILYLESGSPGQFFKDFSQIMAHRKAGIAAIATDPVRKAPKKAADSKPPGITFSFKDQYELEHIEEKILDKEETVERLTDLIQQPEVLNDPEQMRTHCEALKDAQETVSTLYDRWQELEAKKEVSQKR